MATWTLKPGENIKRVDLHEESGGIRQGGISPSRSSPIAMIFTSPAGEQHGNPDGWQMDEKLTIERRGRRRSEILGN
jgi:hypothetical protein